MAEPTMALCVPVADLIPISGKAGKGAKPAQNAKGVMRALSMAIAARGDELAVASNVYSSHTPVVLLPLHCSPCTRLQRN
jgi:hypothetical protein